MGWSGQASQHELDHGKANEGGNSRSVTLEVSCQAAVTADPGKRAFHHPPFGQDGKAFCDVAALDDLDGPFSGFGSSSAYARPLIPAIGEDAFDERKQGPGSFGQHLRGAVAVLDVGRVNGHAQQEAERIDEDVALAALDLLARIEALGVEKSPPLGAPLALWLSMIAAVGLASRPSCSRTATYKT